jgi:hypothetical protein
MNTTLTIINKDLNLKSQKVLVYLRAQNNSSNWETAAWQACAPQPGGGSYTLDSINNTVGAYVSFAGGKGKTALQDIPLQNMSAIEEAGNEVCLDAAQPNEVDLTAQQCGVINLTTKSDVKVIWCLNGSSVCRPVDPMFNEGISSFELMQKVYFTIGSLIETDTFRVQNWTKLQSIDIPADLVSADIVVSVDHKTNKPVFALENALYN